jgi:KilA-N domain
MNNLITKDYAGRLIRINPVNRSTCLTDICKASRKKINNFLRQQNTQDFIRALSIATRISVEKLLIVGKGSLGTWGHHLLAIKCAGWCSPEFEVFMAGCIFELFATGKVELAPQPEPKILLSLEDLDLASNMAMAVASKLIGSKNDLEARLKIPNWQTVTEMLAALGYLREEGSIAMDASFRHWVNKDFCGLYRSRNGILPPQTETKRGGAYCYPPAYIPLLETYLSGYAVNSPNKLTNSQHVQLSLLESITA